MTALPDHIRVRESEECLLTLLKVHALEHLACPSCGSVFVLHRCGAPKEESSG